MFWIIQFLPDGLLYALALGLLITGAVITVVASVLKIVPFINMYRLPIQITGVILLLLGVYLTGVYETEIVWRERVRVAEEKVRAAEARAPEITERVVTEYVDRVRVVKQRVNVVKKEIEVKREIINEGCKLNPTAIDVYNKSITAPEASK